MFFLRRQHTRAIVYAACNEVIRPALLIARLKDSLRFQVDNQVRFGIGMREQGIKPDVVGNHTLVDCAVLVLVALDFFGVILPGGIAVNWDFANRRFTFNAPYFVPHRCKLSRTML